jgi:hypothetical protein
MQKRTFYSKKKEFKNYIKNKKPLATFFCFNFTGVEEQQSAGRGPPPLDRRKRAISSGECRRPRRESTLWGAADLRQKTSGPDFHNKKKSQLNMPSNLILVKMIYVQSKQN